MAKTIKKPLEFKPGDKILISRSDRLGDLILALPLVESIKLRHPECEVHVLASVYASPILENNSRIDKIIRVLGTQLKSNNRYRKEVLKQVRMEAYKAVVVAYPGRLISQLYSKAGIPIRLGTAGRFHSVFFNHHLFHSRRTNKKHECEYNLDFLQHFKDGQTEHIPIVHPSDKELNNAHRILRKKGIGERFIVLHPGSGGSAVPWPLDRFVKLYVELTRAGHDVVFTGSEEEGLFIDKKVKELGAKVRTITGETDLRTLAALLSLASMVVANSTGPLHLAAAVNTSVVGLYPSKKIMSPVRWGPLGCVSKIIQPAVAVCNCPSSSCKCMESITIERVAKETVALLETVDVKTG